jgi:diadenosine hexaphosphate hydrolase (ATP-forming)
VTSPIISGAGGVVFDAQGRVLLLKHQQGKWVFPKGHIDPGETPLEAALREVAEEAGVQARHQPLAQDETRYRNDRGERRRITWYLLETPQSAPVLREETFPEGAFLAPQEALQRLSFEEDRALLRRMLRHLATYPERNPS